MDSEQKPIQQQPVDDQQALDEQQQALNELREEAKTPKDHEYLDKVQREEIDVVIDDSKLPPSDLAPQTDPVSPTRTYRLDPSGVLYTPEEAAQEDNKANNEPPEYGHGGPRA